MSVKDTFFVMLIVGGMSLVGNLVGFKNGIVEAIPGMLILILISIAGVALSKVIPVRIPSVAYIVTLACILTFPGVPGAAFINAAMKKVSFLALTTPILAYAGIAIGKDLDTFKKAGWRIVVLSCVVFVGTYIGSAVIAQFILKMLGQI